MATIKTLYKLDNGEYYVQKDYLPDSKLPRYREYMRNQAMKAGHPDVLPEKVYHVTSLKNYTEIKTKGLTPGVDGCVYLGNEENLDTITEKISAYYDREFLITLEISTEKLNKEKIYKNIDGVGSGYMYFGNIKHFKEFRNK